MSRTPSPRGRGAARKNVTSPCNTLGRQPLDFNDGAPYGVTRNSSIPRKMPRSQSITKMQDVDKSSQKQDANCPSSKPLTSLSLSKSLSTSSKSVDSGALYLSKTGTSLKRTRSLKASRTQRSDRVNDLKYTMATTYKVGKS